jgi:hypothetical protein
LLTLFHICGHHGTTGLQGFRSVNTGAKYFHSSKNAGGNLYGWHSMIARKALS